MKILKKNIAITLTFALLFQLTLGVCLWENTFTVNALEVEDTSFDLVIDETPLKIIYTATLENGDSYSSEYNKLTNKAYMNGKEIVYSYTEGTTVTDYSYNNQITPYASNWDPITVATGYEIDFAPFIDAVAGVAAAATQMYLGHIGVTATSIINRLAHAKLKSHWSSIANWGFGSIISYIGSNASKIINVTFSYDLQRTRGLVNLNGGSVPVTAYRYSNYTGKLHLGGKTVSKNTGQTGGWWSSSKPYSLDYEK